MYFEALLSGAYMLLLSCLPDRLKLFKTYRMSISFVSIFVLPGIIIVTQALILLLSSWFIFFQFFVFTLLV
jgi:hypothetical protein